MNFERTIKSRVTTIMVAKRAGVSQPTVSRVLNNPESVGGETADRVRRAIQELGYIHPATLPHVIRASRCGDDNLVATKGSPRVTVSLVAKCAGVSAATVSRVANSLSVHAKTADHVRQVMQELGYVPVIHTSRRRRSLQRGDIVFLTPGENLEKMARFPIINGVLHGIVSALSEHGLNLIQSTFRHFPALLESRQIGGVIVWPDLADIADDALEMLRPYPIIYVMSAPEDRLRGDRIKTNNSMVGRLAAKHLLSKGHRRLACVTTAGSQSWLWERSSSFLHAAAAHGVPASLSVLESGGDVDFENMEHNQEFESQMERGLRRVLDTKPRPTGWFVPCDGFTAHVYRHLKRLGVQIGKDVEIVSCNNEISILSALDPRPKSIDLNPEEIGRKVVERLLWRMQNFFAEDGCFSVEVKPRLY